MTGLKSHSKSIIIIFCFSFFQGVIQLLGVPTIAPRIIMELLILILFSKTIYLSQQNNIKIKFKWGLWMASIFFITLFSAIINKQDFILTLLFYRHVFIFYLLFVAIYNSNILFQDISKINYYLIGLVTIQIPAAIIKLLTFRKIVEGGGIGTVSVRDGSVALFISLIPISFLFSKYLYNKKGIYFLASMLFLIVSIASGKRATAFVLPVMLLFIVVNYLFLEDKDRIKKIFTMSFGIGIITFSMLFITSQTSSFLNPKGGTFNGAFSLKFMYDKMVLYTMATEAVQPGAGRGTGIKDAYYYVLNQGIDKLLLGFGPGSIIETSLVKGTRSQASVHNLPYGSRSGFVWIFLQIGLIGALSYLFFIIHWFLSIRYKYKRQKAKKEEKEILLGLIGCLFLLFFDYFFYSVSFIVNGVTMPLLMYLSGIYLSPLRRSFRKPT